MAKIKWHGPYKGSKENGGRPIMVGKVKRGGHWETVSKNAARKEYEDAHHTRLSKDTDVDHKDNGGRKGHDALSNLQAMSHSRNVAKENKRRAHNN